MRGQYYGSAGLMVNLDSVIHDLFSYSRTQSRRLIDNGEVKIDGKVMTLVSIAVEDIAGRELEVRGEIVEVPVS